MGVAFLAQNLIEKSWVMHIDLKFCPIIETNIGMLEKLIGKNDKLGQYKIWRDIFRQRHLIFIINIYDNTPLKGFKKKVILKIHGHNAKNNGGNAQAKIFFKII